MGDNFGDVVHGDDCFQTGDATRRGLGVLHAFRAGSGRELGDAGLPKALESGAGYKSSRRLPDGVGLVDY